MYSEKFLNIYYHEEMFFFFFQIFVAKGDTCHFFKKYELMNSTSFINKLPSFLEVMVLIFSFQSIFQSNGNRFINLFLKTKQEKGIYLPYVFLKFYMNQFSNQFLLFLNLVYETYSHLSRA